MLDRAGQALRAELFDLFETGAHATLDDARFDALARRIFAYQFERNEPYAAYCLRRGRTPDSIADWREIPAVPTAAFKEVPLASGDIASAEAVFRTSGTTRGPEKRGEHYILDLSIYHAALLPVFAAYVLPDGAELPFLSLMPSPRDLPDSSLAHMIDVVMDRLGSDRSGYFASADAGIDVVGLDDALRRFTGEGQPVALLGTSLAFVHWLDHLEESGWRYELPPGSRIMDTGGYKGSTRVIAREELLERYHRLLGIPPDSCVNEYGMTELTSQCYDVALRERVLARTSGPVAELAAAAVPASEESPPADVSAPRAKRGPAWMRTTVVDPDTLEEVPPGTLGLLRHTDLANLGSVAFVQTEDLGRQLEDGAFELVGRAAGAMPRGCSIAMDLLLGG